MRRPYHVRTHVGAEFHERILREAAVQRRSVSECVRDALEELYEIRDELSRPLEVSDDERSAGGRLAQRLLNELEERMSGGLSQQLTEIQSLGDQLRKLEAITDRQYVSLMLYLPDISESGAEERSASANRRYQAWRRAVDKLFDSPKRRP
jgi:hypothetical protein